MCSKSDDAYLDVPLLINWSRRVFERLRFWCLHLSFRSRHLNLLWLSDADDIRSSTASEKRRALQRFKKICRRMGEMCGEEESGTHERVKAFKGIRC
jgi:hypothetical protein